MRAPFQIAGVVIKPGERTSIELPVPSLYTHTQLEMPVHVVHGRKPGPTLFLSGAVHGDEINGVEIIRRVLHTKSLNRMHGTLLAIPVVNIFGFINQSRYLPDRRDLNRSFPGSDTGSLAARIAHLFLNVIVSRCSHGIDLHTGAIHRENLPQVRAVLDDEETEKMARAFRSPVILNTSIVDGSLRKAVEDLGISVIVYEAGEALRFDEVCIRAGVRGVLSVMRELGMLPRLKSRKTVSDPIIVRSSSWVRASQSGILRMVKAPGAWVKADELLGIVSDPFGEKDQEIRSPFNGIIIGKTNIPLVSEGEALFHVARFRQSATAEETIGEFQQTMDPATDNSKPAEPPLT